MKNHHVKIETYESYLFDIQDWEIDYSFSLNKEPRFSPGPFSEHSCLKITAMATCPKRTKGKKFVFWLLGSRELDDDLDNPMENLREPKGVGELTDRGDSQNYFGGIPQSFLRGYLECLEKGHFKSLLLQGPKIRYGKATITYLNFAKYHDPEEY